MRYCVRKHLLDLFDGHEIFVTKLSTGYRYRIECRDEVVHSGVMSFEHYNNIYQIVKHKSIYGKNLGDVEEDTVDEEIEETKDKLEELKEEKDRIVKELEDEDEEDLEEPVIEELDEEDVLTDRV